MTSVNKHEDLNDVSELTWMSLLGLLSPREYFITVDHSPIWRRHISWAKESGSDLRTHMTQRFASNMVFMSLILGAELGVLFNSSNITTLMREEMRNSSYHTILFWIGVLICVSVILTIFTLITTFTAWGMVSSVSDNNAHCILRSSIGQYIAELPTRLIVTAIYAFLFWLVMFLFILLPGFFSYLLLLMVAGLFFHFVVVFSAFGRLIIHTGAMGSKRILDPDFEKALMPSGLHNSLLIKAMDSLRKKKSVMAQYRLSRKDLSSPKSDRLAEVSGHTVDTRKDSLASQEDTLIKNTSQALSRSPVPSIKSLDTSPESAASPKQVQTSSETSTLLRRRIPRRFGHTVAGNIIEEWADEQACRSIYDAPPPADLLVSSDDENESGDKGWRFIGGTRFPRPSLLNSAHLTHRSFRRIFRPESENFGENSESEKKTVVPIALGLTKLARIVRPKGPRRGDPSKTPSPKRWHSDQKERDKDVTFVEDDDCVPFGSISPQAIECTDKSGEEHQHLLADEGYRNRDYSTGMQPCVPQTSAQMRSHKVAEDQQSRVDGYSASDSGADKIESDSDPVYGDLPATGAPREKLRTTHVV